MRDEQVSPTISPASLACAGVVPSRQCRSSRTLPNWSALLLDIHSGVTSYEPYDAVPTPDFRVGVGLAGRFDCEAYGRGAWRHATHDPGSIMLHNTDEPTRYRFPRPKDEDYRLACIYLPIGDLQAAHDLLRGARPSTTIPNLSSVIRRDPAIAQMAHALAGAMLRGEDGLYAQTVAAWLCVHLITTYGLQFEDERARGMISDARLTRVVDYIAANYALPLTLENLAAEACVSKFHFTRLFRDKLGVTPGHYLSDVRLDAARRLLVSSDLPVAEVGRLCGYPVATHFSAAFARRFSQTPRGYRRVQIPL